MKAIYNFKNYMVLIACSFMCGISVFYCFDIIFTNYIFIFLSVQLLVMLSFIFVKIISHKKVSKPFILSIIFIIFMLLGILRISYIEYKTVKSHSLFKSGALYSGIMVSEPKIINDNYKSAIIFVTDYRDDYKKIIIEKHIKLFYNESEFSKVKYGDTVKFIGKVNTRSNKDKLLQAGNNTVATLSAKTCIKTDITLSSIHKSLAFGELLNLKIDHAINSVFNYSPHSIAVLKGILTGDTSEFSSQLYNGFSDAGFMHIAAVSGTHISILFSFLSGILGTLKLNRKAVTLISIPVLFTFSAVAGFTPSALRASIMLSTALFAWFVNREYDMLTALFFSAVIILLIYPVKLFSASFQLSFGATLGIALFYRGLNKLFISLSKSLCPVFLINSVALSSASFLGTLPFCLSHFNTINFISLLTNIWIIPIVTIVFCLGLLSSIIFYVCPWISFNVLRYLCEPFIFLIVKTANMFLEPKYGILEFDFVPSALYTYSIAFMIILRKLIKISHRND